MTEAQYFKNLQQPTGKVDVILDTDVSNEIDDQFAIAYLLRCGDKLNTVGLCSAPFSAPWDHVDSPAEGAKKTWETLQEVVRFADREDLLPICHPGADAYLPDEKTPVISEAAAFIVETAKKYSPEKPLYVVAIGAITNVASALLMEPAIAENIVIVWLGGHAQHMPKTDEFNMFQDIAAARVVFDSAAPLVQLPCFGVVDAFSVTRYELEYWLLGKGKLPNYLAEKTIAFGEAYAAGKPWSRVLWDVTAVAWLMNDGNRFMEDDLRAKPIPEYDRFYGYDNRRPMMRYVYHVNRDALCEDLFTRLTK